jgi:hypothetical protein
MRTLANGLNDNLNPKDKVYDWYVSIQGEVVEISEWAYSHPHKEINLLGLNIIYQLQLKIFIDIYEKKIIVSDNIKLP